MRRFLLFSTLLALCVQPSHAFFGKSSVDYLGYVGFKPTPRGNTDPPKMYEVQVEPLVVSFNRLKAKRGQPKSFLSCTGTDPVNRKNVKKICLCYESSEAALSDICQTGYQYLCSTQDLAHMTIYLNGEVKSGTLRKKLPAFKVDRVMHVDMNLVPVIKMYRPPDVTCGSIEVKGVGTGLTEPGVMRNAFQCGQCECAKQPDINNKMPPSCFALDLAQHMLELFGSTAPKLSDVDI